MEGDVIDVIKSTDTETKDVKKFKILDVDVMGDNSISMKVKKYKLEDDR